MDANRARVRNLSGGEIWLFVMGRVLVGFGLGIAAMAYWPGVFSTLGLPISVVGCVILAIGAKGLFRKRD